MEKNQNHRSIQPQRKMTQILRQVIQTQIGIYPKARKERRLDCFILVCYKYTYSEVKEIF